jgi:hypothetical protein
MISKVLLLCFGLLCAAFAAPLAFDETQIVHSRWVAQSVAREQPQPTAAVEAAYRDLSNAARRDDVLSSVVTTARYLANPTVVLSSPVTMATRLDRIESAASELAAVSPLDAQAWCTLLLAVSSRVPVDVDRMARLYVRCIETGSREVAYFDGRMLVALSAWHVLPEQVRLLALDDARRFLGDGHYRGWAAARLAFATATLAPDLEPIVRAVILETDAKLMSTFDAGLRQYRPQPPGGKR